MGIYSTLVITRKKAIEILLREEFCGASLEEVIFDIFDKSPYNHHNFGIIDDENDDNDNDEMEDALRTIKRLE